MEAIKYGHKFLKRGGTIYCDNNGAIKEFKIIHPRIKVSRVRGKENPAHRPSKMSISEKEKRADYPTIESCRTLNLRWHKKPKKLKKKTNGREYFDGGNHYHLIRTVDGEAWMTSSKFKKYQKWLRKKNRDKLITRKYNH